MSQRLNLWIAIGLVLGLIVGLSAAASGAGWLNDLATLSAPFGRLFINAIRMVVIPLVVALVFASLARAGGAAIRGTVQKTAIFYGLILFPGIALGMGVTSLLLRFAPETAAPEGAGPDVPELPSLIDFVVGLLPANPFAAAASGALLPLLVFAALLGLATGALEAERRVRMVRGAEDFSAALIKLVHWVLWLAPIGVFGLIAPATARLGWDLVANLGLFIAGVLIALALLVGLIYVPALIWQSRMSPAKFFSGTVQSASVAFATTSTAAAIPVTLENTIDRLGVSRGTAEFLIPLSASIFRPGSALFQGAAIVFLAHLFDIDLGPAGYMTALFATFIVSLTVAPVPSASVMTLAPALTTLGITSAGLGLLLGIDRIPDMFRSAVNVWGHIVVAVLADNKTSRETSTDP